jgi:hypothetical protein
VLLTPGNLGSALAVARSLGRNRVPVTIADEGRRRLAGASRLPENRARSSAEVIAHD